jgi:hypothetical protein
MVWKKKGVVKGLAIDLANTKPPPLVLAANSLFPIVYKLPTPMSFKHRSFVAISNKRHFHCLRHLHIYFSSNFHDCKRENFSFRGLICDHYLKCRHSFINIFYGTYLWFIVMWLKRFWNYAHLDILTLIA